VTYRKEQTNTKQVERDHRNPQGRY